MHRLDRAIFARGLEVFDKSSFGTAPNCSIRFQGGMTARSSCDRAHATDPLHDGTIDIMQM